MVLSSPPANMTIMSSGLAINGNQWFSSSAVTSPANFSGTLDVGERTPDLWLQGRANVLLAPPLPDVTLTGKNYSQLALPHHRCPVIGGTYRGQRRAKRGRHISDCVQNRFGIAASPGLTRRLAGEHRHRTLGSLKAALYVKWVPVSLILSLGDAVAVLSGVTQYAPDRTGRESRHKRSSGSVALLALL